MSGPYRAVRIEAAEAERRIEAAERAHREADAATHEAAAIVEAARREAARITELARAQRDEKDTALRAVASETVDRYLDTKRIEAAAVAAARLIRDAGEVRREFDALTPWLTRFLREAVDRLVGALDDDELMARLVAEGVASLKDSRQVTASVHPADIETLQRAREAHPLRFAGVGAIRADARLKPGSIVLEGPGGTMEAGLETQLTLLCRELDALG